MAELRVIKVSSEKGKGTRFNIYVPEDKKRGTGWRSTSGSGLKSDERIMAWRMTHMNYGGTRKLQYLPKGCVPGLSVYGLTRRISTRPPY